MYGLSILWNISRTVRIPHLSFICVYAYVRACENAKMVVIFKKGNKKDLKNYRPLCLLLNIYKVLTKVLTKRLEKTLDENQPESKLDSEADTQRQTTSTS